MPKTIQGLTQKEIRAFVKGKEPCDNDASAIRTLGYSFALIIGLFHLSIFSVLCSFIAEEEVCVIDCGHPGLG